MIDRDTLLRAICASPDDDAPRLAFADWLDEHGDPHLAEFIRVQVELARLPTGQRPGHPLAGREQQLFARPGAWTHVVGHELQTTYLDLNCFDRGFHRVWRGESFQFARLAKDWWQDGPIDLAM